MNESAARRHGRKAGAQCGDAETPVYVRSAAKPFQAMPLLLAGGEKKFGLGDAEIALMCASHGGEPRHVQETRKILRRGGFRADDLACGAHSPMHEASARELVRRGEKPSALHNNCSGKHAGLLLACRALGLAHEGYTDPGHALQRRIRTLVPLSLSASRGFIRRMCEPGGVLKPTLSSS